MVCCIIYLFYKYFKFTNLVKYVCANMKKYFLAFHKAGFISGETMIKIKQQNYLKDFSFAIFF